LTSLLSCGTKQLEHNFPSIDNQTIQSISKVVINKIRIDTNLHLHKPILFADTLYRFHLTHLTLNPDFVSDRDMLNYVIANKRFLDTIPFLKVDSSYLLAQERQIESAKLTSFECVNIIPNNELADTQERLLKENKFSLGRLFYTFNSCIFPRQKNCNCFA
jgi:hypothetical protein